MRPNRISLSRKSSPGDRGRRPFSSLGRQHAARSLRGRSRNGRRSGSRVSKRSSRAGEDSGSDSEEENIDAARLGVFFFGPGMSCAFDADVPDGSYDLQLEVFRDHAVAALLLCRVIKAGALWRKITLDGKPVALALVCSGRWKLPDRGRL